MSEKSKRLFLQEDIELPLFYGKFDENLKQIESLCKVSLSARGNSIIINGEDGGIDFAEEVLKRLIKLASMGYIIDEQKIRLTADLVESKKDLDLEKVISQNVKIPTGKKTIEPKSPTQAEYIISIKKYDIVFGIGPAGTGKTYLAMALAVSFLLSKKVKRIILTRPAIEAGERLGFLPGDLYAKVNPYLKPLYDALYDMLDVEKTTQFVEKGFIEIAPLAYMRGRTLNDSIVVLDEAQNTTSEQMKMFLTRLGFDSKAIITGDITQIDLPAGKLSGLVEAKEILKDIKDLKFVYFSDRDIIRHSLVQQIVRAYENRKKKK
ncbi:PhoH family protein [bacterium]|nr:PhoH family protein [bacterium]